MKIITVWFEKGGTGKTTVAYNIAAGLKRQEKKVLLIDIDPSAGSTKHAGINPATVSKGLPQLLMLMVAKADPIVQDYISSNDEIDILPTSSDLEGIESTVRNLYGDKSVFLFLPVMEQLKEKYDYVIFDGAPSRSIYNISALAICDKVIMPMRLNYLDFGCVEEVVDSLLDIKEKYNPNMKIEGILPTQCKNTKHSVLIQDALDTLYKRKGIPTIPVQITEGIPVADAALRGVSVLKYQRWSKQAKQFQDLVEVIK